MIWRFIKTVVRMAFAASLMLPAIHLAKPDISRWDAFFVGMSLACGVFEAARLAREETAK